MHSAPLQHTVWTESRMIFLKCKILSWHISSPHSLCPPPRSCPAYFPSHTWYYPSSRTLDSNDLDAFIPSYPRPLHRLFPLPRRLFPTSNPTCLTYFTSIHPSDYNLNITSHSGEPSPHLQISSSSNQLQQIL